MSIVGLVTSLIAGIVGIIMLVSLGFSGIATMLGVASAVNEYNTSGYDNYYDYETPDLAPGVEYSSDYFTSGDEVTSGYEGTTYEDEPAYQNSYVRLYVQDNGETKIVLDNAFPNSTYLAYRNATIFEIYNSINNIRSMDGKSAIPEDLFYEILTVSLCDDSYFAASDEESAFNVEYMTAIAAYVAASTLDICPEAHVTEASVDSNDVYTVYFDNGISLKFNTRQDDSLSGYPFYVIYDYNGTDISDYYSTDTLSVYLYAVENIEY